VVLARFYADTYALIEIPRGNPAYEKHVNEELVTSEFNYDNMVDNLIKKVSSFTFSS